jgi:hypothetical protein
MSGLPLLPVPIAALLSGVVAASAAAQGAAPGSFFPLAESRQSAVVATNAAGQEQTSPPRKPSLAGNPLWAIPLGDLAETHARPLFSPSRRPPAPVLAAPASPPVKPASPAKPERDHPLLTLLGTIVGEAVEIGVFADDTSRDVICLKAGEVRDGWTLSAISGRAAIFQKPGYRAAVLALPAPAAEGNAPGAAVAPHMEPVGALGNGRTIAVPPPYSFAPPVIPAPTKGGSARPPREG